MNIGEILRAAKDAGITIGIDGDDLVLKASAEPPREMLDLFASHKPGIMRWLRPGSDGWSIDEWQELFQKRASIADNMGFGRLDAETNAFHDCVDHWLTINPPLANQHGECLRCGNAVSPKQGVTVACSSGTKGWLHPECAPDWRNLRRWQARTDLNWLLQRTRTTAT
jgi:hypothetical protein